MFSSSLKNSGLIQLDPDVMIASNKNIFFIDETTKQRIRFSRSDEETKKFDANENPIYFGDVLFSVLPEDDRVFIPINLGVDTFILAMKVDNESCQNRTFSISVFLYNSEDHQKFWGGVTRTGLTTSTNSLQTVARHVEVKRAKQTA